MDDQPKPHDIAVDDPLYWMLYYLARVDQKKIRTLVRAALEEYGRKRGVYVSTKSTLLEVCPLCKRDLDEKSVASDLLKRGVWVCRECRKQIVRERDEWAKKNMPTIDAARPARPGPRVPVGPPRAMRDSAKRPAGGGPRD